MLKNYLKVAFRNLTKHKGYTFINVAGLSVGVACCLLIMLFVKSEWSFDRFHAKSDRIYRAWIEEHYQGEFFRNTVTPVPLGPVIQNGLPEAEQTCRVAGLKIPVKYNNVTFNDPVTIVDSNFFTVFDFELTEGNISNPFPANNALVITEKVAKKYFGNISPIGKYLELQLGDDKLLFAISAIAKDPPIESSIQFEMLIPFSNASHIWSEHIRTAAWSNVTVETYVLLKNGASVELANSKLASVMNPLVAKNYKAGEYLIRLQPMKDIHFNSTLPDEMSKPSDPKYAYILASIGLLILLIACINFVTLSIGRSTTRAMEVGIRKVLGAERKQLIKQFWGEAFLLAIIALIVGIIISLSLQKAFSQLADRELTFSFDGFTILFCLFLTAIIALFAGIYPALILSDFKPIHVKKGSLTSGSNIGFFRKSLIVGQFVASIIMIICTITVAGQLKYLTTKDLGYNKEHIVVVPTNKARKEGNKLAKLFKAAIEKKPEAISITVSLYSMAEPGWMGLGYTDNANIFRQFKFNAIDADFCSTMNLELLQGRIFLKDNEADSNCILVNEALVKEYGWKNAIGQRLPGKYDVHVIGVVKDFHIESLHETIYPTVLALKPDSIFRHSSDVSYNDMPEPRITVRFRGGDLAAHIELLRTTWKGIAGSQDFEYKFLDDVLNAGYQQEQRLAKIVRYASFLSIFIACMGLFGLATLIVVRRTKEIGIRKVLGASMSGIVTLLSKDFILLVIIASLIAFPLAWWSLQKWLQDFAYRIDIPWLAFPGGAVFALVVALVTVSIQALKAASANPVKSLRTE